MKTAKEQIYEYIQKNSLLGLEQGFQTEEIAKKFAIKRSNASTILNQLTVQGLLEKTKTRPVIYSLNNQQKQEESCFQEMIGHDGSLKNIVQLAKAAILYPAKMLPTLIVAPIGAGTTLFVRMMYRFAMESQMIKPEAKLQRIDIANYLDNLEIVHHQLFTTNKKENIFLNSNDGVVFIDNANLLPGADLDLLLESIENNELLDLSRILMVFGVTKGCNEEQLARFYLHTPIQMEIPNLNNRPLNERFALINSFFQIEAKQSQIDIVVNSEIITALLLYDCPLNIRQLNNDITAACASSYVRNLTNEKSQICTITQVIMSDFGNDVRKGLLNYKKNASELKNIVNQQQAMIYHHDDVGLNPSSDSIYVDLQSKEQPLQSRELESKEIQQMLDDLLSDYQNQYQLPIKIERANLEKTINPKIIELVDQFIMDCEHKFKKKYSKNVFYGLCLHIHSLILRQNTNIRVNDADLQTIVKQYHQEHLVAQKLAGEIKDKFKISITENEIAILVFFIINYDERVIFSRPRLLICMHGDSSADSIKNVVVALSNNEQVYSYDLSLNKDIAIAYQELKELIIRIDNGKGIIVLYDMGSFRTMFEHLQRETNIQIRLLNFPFTMVAIDGAHKCIMSNDIEEVYHSLICSVKDYMKQTYRPNVIVTLCRTGEGGAIQLKNYIDKYSKLHYETIPLAISDRSQLVQELNDIELDKNIYTFVGTYDPKLLGIPFIALSDIMNCAKERIDDVLRFKKAVNLEDDYNDIYDFLETQLTETSIKKIRNTVPTILEEIDKSYHIDYSTKIGLMVHFASMINRLLKGEPSAINLKTATYQKCYQDIYKDIAKKMRIIEKQFEIIIQDNEIAFILEIIMKI
ncbi:PRD domain-containing protein [Amedibacillus sp. YH-ame6]